MPATGTIPGSSARRAFAPLLSYIRVHRGYFLGLSLVCVVIVIAAVQNYRAIHRELTEVTLSRRTAVTELAATALSERFARLVDLSVSLATRVRFRELVATERWGEAGAILRGVPRDFPFVDRLILTDPGGTLKADVPEAPEVHGVNFAFREWYKGVHREWRPYVSPAYRRTAAPQRNVFGVAVPVRDPIGAVAAILVLQVRAESLFEWVKGIDFGPGGFVYVVDSKGQIVFDSRRPGREDISDVSAVPFIQRLMRGARGVEVGFDPIEREESIIAYATVAEYGWGVVAQQPARESLGLEVRNEQLRLLLMAYGLIVALCSSAIYIASRIAIERSQADEDRRVKAGLERQVAERTAQLEASNKELESFSYSVSHDLRSPLRAIDGFSRILQEDHNDKLDDEGRRLLGVIRDNSRNMGQLIDDLLEFSRLGRKPLAATAIDMKHMVEEVLKEVQTDSGRQPELVIGDLPPAHGDITLVKQVWVNLLANAVKFSGKRGRPAIEVSGYENGAENVYCVKDNGAGFDMRYYDKLFGVFQRLHRLEEYSGTGVGLAIVQRVVTRHGGRVWAEGKIDEGAAFYFALPKRGGA